MIGPLPNELVESIIKNLYSDITTLLSCALVGRAWVHSSQRGIFRRIVLTMVPNGCELEETKPVEGYMELTRQLTASFDAKPVLATYVHSLELQVRWVRQPYEDEMQMAATRVIRRLTNVKHVFFYVIYWERLPDSFKATFTDLLRAPSLTRISMSGFSMPTFTELASFLSHAEHVKVLNLDIAVNDLDVTFLESEFLKTSYPPRSIQLNELTLSVNHQFIPWFRKDWCPFEIRNLQTLHLDSGAFVDKIGLLKLAGENLRDLQLMDLKPSDLNNYLEYTPNLNILRLGIFSGAPHSNNVAIIQSIFEPLFNQDGKRFPLQHLTIHVQPDYDHLVGTLAMDKWVTIDALFEKPEFGLLETVQFNMVVDITANSFEASFRSNFPLLEKSGKLVVNINTI